ncbi:MAG: AmmeMemoRadiSam system protein B [Campylobacterota bacterium]|nr:AmmeMemoRadiSam system protein B [Campylobacterota bacterium]
MKQRKLAVSGQFYPSVKEELLKYINHFNKVLEDNNIEKNYKNQKAIIVPHAGYVYSGFTANIGFSQIPKTTKNIVVIGPSHKYAFDGASISLYENYPTPLGELKIDQRLSNDLVNNFDFLTFNDTVHCEHSTETQFPFIKYYLPDVNVIEIIYSKIDYERLSEVIEYVLKEKDTFIVISTDLSHFYNLNTAHKLDNICLESIQNKDVNLAKKGCEACGIVGVEAVLNISKKYNYSLDILDYRTSADTSNDTSSVVGYTSAVIFDEADG